MFNKNYFNDIALKILKTDSPSGFTKNIMKCLEEIVIELGYEITYDNKGTGSLKIPGKDTNYTIGLACHVDTLGLMVRSISGNGTLNVTNIGGPIINTLDGEYCKIYTRDNKVYTGTILSTSPAVHVFKDASTKTRDISNIEIRLDEIVKNKSDVEKLGIQNGDYICYDPKTVITEKGFIKSRFLDDKISAATILSVLQYLKENNEIPRCNIEVVFSVFEEVGFGASYINSSINELLAVDMGCIGLDLSCTEYDVSICAKDSGGPYDYEMTSKLIEIAKDNKLQYAVDIYPYYSSDATSALRSGNNIKAALIGPGVSASHGMERTHYQAIENTMKLIYLYIQSK